VDCCNKALLSHEFGDENQFGEIRKRSEDLLYPAPSRKPSRRLSMRSIGNLGTSLSRAGVRSSLARYSAARRFSSSCLIVAGLTDGVNDLGVDAYSAGMDSVLPGGLGTIMRHGVSPLNPTSTCSSL
jgi:hypothetical protein